MSFPEPGWYPDPENPNQQKGWDGTRWSTYETTPTLPSHPTRTWVNKNPGWQKPTKLLTFFHTTIPVNMVAFLTLTLTRILLNHPSGTGTETWVTIIRNIASTIWLLTIITTIITTTWFILKDRTNKSTLTVGATIITLTVATTPFWVWLTF